MNIHADSTADSSGDSTGTSTAKHTGASTTNSTAYRTGFPTFEDAARVGHARRKLAKELASAKPLTLSWITRERGKDVNVPVSLPPIAVEALHRVLACLSAGRGVSIEPLESEIEIDEAALLLGTDVLELLDALTSLGGELRKEGSDIMVGTKTVGQCFAVVHRDCPEELTKHDDSPEEAAERQAEWESARTLLTRYQRDFVTRLYFDLRDAGNGFFPDLAVLDYYFGRKTIVAIRPAAWSSLPHKQKP